MEVESEIKTTTTGQVIEVVVRAAVPVLFMCIGWIGSSLIDHNERLAKIEASRYTPKDAKEDMLRIEATVKSSEIRRDEWLRERFSAITGSLQRIDDKLGALEQRVSKAEVK